MAHGAPRNDLVKAPASVTATGLANVLSNAQAKTASFATMTLDKDDHLYFDIEVNGGTAKTVTIDQALINSTLTVAGTEVTDGKIATVDDYKKVVEAALTAAKVTGVSVVKEGTALVFKTAAVGENATIHISNVVNSSGGDTVNVFTIDISDKALADLGAVTTADGTKIINAHLDVVNAALIKVTDASADIGSIAKRIELQSSFVDALMDTIDEGISGLIDADMSEESTRLQALQFKQKLGVQALSIANQSAQNILSLFQ